MTPAKGYTEMKDSGIEWISEIPAHWGILRGKNVLRLLERPVKPDDDVITCFRDGEVTLRKNRREEGFTNSLKEIGYQGIEPGDLIVHGMDGFAGSIGISDSRGKASPVLNVMDSNQNKRYLMYYLRAMAYKDVFMALSTGIRVRSCDLRWNKLSVFPFLIPTSHEQSAIAAYLDTQCAKIDEIIAQAKASIEDYKQWKASIIYKAVTKGLDPNVEMKDSGIEWIGRMPKRWKVIPLKLCTDKIGSGKTPVGGAETYQDNGVLFLRSQNVYNTGLKLDGVYYISDEVDATMKNSRVRYNDVLLNITGGSIGRCCLFNLPDTAANVNQHVCIIRTKPEILLPQFLRYFWNSASGPIVIDQYQTGSNRQGLNFEQIGATHIPLCSIAEQQQIVAMLDKKCAVIDQLMAEKQSLIDDLESYKKSLIYEVVTGKRRVC